MPTNYLSHTACVSVASIPGRFLLRACEGGYIVCQLSVLSKVIISDRSNVTLRTINRMDRLLSGQPASMDTKMLLII